MNIVSTATDPSAAAPPERLPLDFLVVGAQKCATSWLYMCLADHPQIRVPLTKREKTYLGGPWFREHGSAGFMECFGPGSGGMQRTGHVSVDYMYDPAAIGAVESLVGKPKIIASLRRPVDRMISGYYWLYRKGRFDAGSDASSILDSLVGPDGRFRQDLPHDEAELVRRGFYAEQLRPFVERFGPDNVLVVGYREIGAEPLATLARIYGFLGVDAGHVPAALESRPKLNAQLPVLHRIERLVKRVPPALHLIDWLNQRLARRRESGQDAIRPDVRARLEQAYAPAEGALAALLGELPASNRPVSY